MRIIVSAIAMGQSPCSGHCNYIVCLCKQGKAEVLVEESRGVCVHTLNPPPYVFCVCDISVYEFTIMSGCVHGCLCFCGGVIILYAVHVCACARACTQCVHNIDITLHIGMEEVLVH